MTKIILKAALALTAITSSVPSLGQSANSNRRELGYFLPRVRAGVVVHAPLTLEYGATSGGTAVAGVINSGGTALTTLRDAETAAITRRLAREKAQHDLNDLLDALAPATAP